MNKDIVEKAYLLMEEEERKTFRNNEWFNEDEYEFIIDSKSIDEILEYNKLSFLYIEPEMRLFGIKVRPAKDETRHIRLVKTVGEYIWEEEDSDAEK